MSTSHFSEPAQINASSRAQLARSEADLARLVASHETQALVTRSTQRILNLQDPRACLTQNLLRLVRQLQGKELAR
jgi:hypothetical protein